MENVANLLAKCEADRSQAEAIWSTDYAFFAKLHNGNFKAWGDGTQGAYIVSSVESRLKSVGLEVRFEKLMCFFWEGWKEVPGVFNSSLGLRKESGGIEFLSFP